MRQERGEKENLEHNQIGEQRYKKVCDSYSLKRNLSNLTYMLLLFMYCSRMA